MNTYIYEIIGVSHINLQPVERGLEIERNSVQEDLEFPRLQYLNLSLIQDLLKHSRESLF